MYRNFPRPGRCIFLQNPTRSVAYAMVALYTCWHSVLNMSHTKDVVGIPLSTFAGGGVAYCKSRVV